MYYFLFDQLDSYVCKHDSGGWSFPVDYGI